MRGGEGKRKENEREREREREENERKKLINYTLVVIALYSYRLGEINLIKSVKMNYISMLHDYRPI